MLASISFNQSHKSNMAHNNRENVHGNPGIDQSRLDENIYFVQKDIREVYEDVFGEAVESYNAKQSRKDRKIEDYYDKIHNDSKTHEQRELVVAIGEGKDDEKYRTAKKAALIQYAEEFQERNPNLAVYNMVLHDDEANPHLHINYVPNFESKRGLTKRVGMDKALQQQGIEGKGTELIKHWRERETARIEELSQEKMPEFERANVGSHKYMKVPQFKEYAEQKKELEQSLKAVESRLSDLGKSLDHVKKVDEVEVKEKGGLIRSKTVELAQEDFESIKTLAKNSEALKTKSEQFENDWIREVEKNDRLKDENKALKKENDLLKKENQELKRENTFLKRTLEKVKELYKEKAPELANVLGYVKANILDKAKEKLLQRYFTDDKEIQGAQKFLADKEQQKQVEKTNGLER
jgi:uncharacterized protein YukE